MNLVLCGMMGAGKTTIGIKLSALTGLRWFDTDQMIEDKYGKISDIFEYYGEARFRKMETELVKKLSLGTDFVISTGGGLILKKENAELLKKNGTVIFLRASFETLKNRLKINENRPLLKGNFEKVESKLKELLTERSPVYEQVADVIVDVDEGTADENAEKVLRAMENLQKTAE